MSTERLARACARRPWTTLGAWVLALVLGIATIVALLDLTSEGELTSNPESERGYEAIGRHFPPDPNEEYVNELILVRSATSTVDDPAFRDKVGALFAEVESSGVANNAESFYESEDASPRLGGSQRDADPGRAPRRLRGGRGHAGRNRRSRRRRRVRRLPVGRVQRRQRPQRDPRRGSEDGRALLRPARRARHPRARLRHARRGDRAAASSPSSRSGSRSGSPRSSARGSTSRCSCSR